MQNRLTQIGINFKEDKMGKWTNVREKRAMGFDQNHLPTVTAEPILCPPSQKSLAFMDASDRHLHKILRNVQQSQILPLMGRVW